VSECVVDVAGGHEDVVNVVGGGVAPLLVGKAPMRITDEAVRVMSGMPFATASQGASAPAPPRNPMMVRSFDYSTTSRR
jgi:hypothetical protein